VSGAPALLAALLGALAAVAGVLWFGWPAYTLMAIFWCENLVIGVVTVLSMLTIGAVGGRLGAATAGAAFFCAHYGLFCFVHGAILAELFGPATGDRNPPALVGALLWQALGQPFAWIVLVAMVGFAVQDAWQGWQRRDPHDPKTLSDAMSAPYGRLVVLHMALLGGAFAVLALDAASAGVLLLVGLKFALDVASARRAARSQSAER
jgi:Family of unknown function (DUF6498)